MPSDLFSLKMRAAADGRHISGAEKIVAPEDLPVHMRCLLERALHHANGEPDFINFKLERLSAGSILHLDALPVRSLAADTPEDGLARMRDLLASLGIARAGEIVGLLRGLRGMRGAALLDADTLERLDSDPSRGVRATVMDAARSPSETPSSAAKNHYAEAMVLAAKVANAPGIVAELCISDDPDYVTGYIASKSLGYVRIAPLKQLGSPAGGRIFLYRGTRADVARTIDFLEKRPVVVHGIPPRPQDASAPQAEPVPPPSEAIRHTLRELRERSLFRTEEVFESPPAPHVRQHGREILMFASNDYLDLANDPRMKEAAAAAVLRYGTGTGGSRLTTGTLPVHRELERALADFKGTEDAVVFATGFAANSGVVPALCPRGSVVFSDELNHASIIDGCRLSGAKIVVYRHNDMADLERKIAAESPRRGLVVSDAVFSMDGDVADLPGLLECARKHRLFSMIDEAHATGVVGPGGHGVLSLFPALKSRPDVIMGTLSKALGSEGGFVCVSHEMAEYLRNRTRSYIFSTAPSPASMAAALEAIRIIGAEPGRVERLQANVAFFLNELHDRGIDAKTQSAIVPIVIGDSDAALAAAASLRRENIVVSPIRYPSVPEGTARLRLTVMATHSEDDLRRCADALARALGQAVRTHF